MTATRVTIRIPSSRTRPVSVVVNERLVSAQLITGSIFVTLSPVDQRSSTPRPLTTFPIMPPLSSAPWSAECRLLEKSRYDRAGS